MSSKPLIVNELLAFIDHTKDSINEVSILDIRKSIFNLEEICSGKTLLYETLGKAAQMPSRRRDKIGEKTLQDIITLLKDSHQDEALAFCARRLHKLPPVSFDLVDVMLKDITVLKSSLQLRVEALESAIFELLTKLFTLKSNNSVSSSPVASNI